VLALFVSHGVSFVQNYLLKGEYAAARPEKLMGSPYGRIVVMHIAILAGGFLTMAIGSPAPPARCAGCSKNRPRRGPAQPRTQKSES
jgi:hypothetical protein